MTVPHRFHHLIAAVALLYLSTLGAPQMEANPGQPLAWRLVTSGQPSLRMDPFISTDSVSKRGILFGGASSAAPLVGLDDTWEFDGNAWNRLNPSPTIVGPRHGCGQMAFDPYRNLTVLFGGYGHLNLFGYNDVYEFNGSAWNLNNIPGPSIGNGASVVYDQARRVFVLFGGNDPWTGDRKTYTYDGQQFTLVAEQNQGPSRRIYAGMAYDPIRQKTYLFGGRWEFTDPDDPQNTWTEYYNDTWEWDGTRWTQLFPAGLKPSKRNCGGMMIWHPTWERVVIHGGSGENYSALSDTWTWDGTKWKEHQPQNTPSSRYGICWYDETRDALMMFGGLTNTPFKIWDETWELVGELNAPTSTPTPTHTPSPTPTRTPTPTASPVPFAATLWAEWDDRSYVHTLDMSLFNLGPEVTASCYLAVEVGGVFYFYPAFTNEMLPMFTGVTIPTGFLLQRTNLLRLPVGAPLGFPLTITWYAAFLSEPGMALHGNLASSSVTLR